MKPGWKVEKLGDVCKIFAGGDVPKNSFSKTKTDKYPIPIFSNGEKNKGLYGYTNVARVTVPSITISGRGTIGYSEIREEKFYPAIRLIVATPNKDILNLFFLQYAITNIDFKHSGTSIPQLTVPMISGYFIPIPPLPEQQRIVAVLDEAFASIAQAKANAERNLSNARELFESVLQSSMSNDDWEKKTLKEISITFGRGKSKNRPRNDPKLYGGKYPFIQTGDIRNSNHYITEYSQTYSELGLAQSKLWPKGTICITIAANIAETGILGFDSCFPDSVIGLVVNPKIADVDFIEYLLQYFKKKLQAKGKGSAQDNLNMEKFENEYFPIPPLAEQRAIVGRLEALSAETGRLEAVYRQKVAALEALKKSVLQRAFEGQLSIDNYQLTIKDML